MSRNMSKNMSKNMSYNRLLKYLKKQSDLKVTIKPIYLVITMPNENHHITIYQDQWDLYQSVTELPYHMFHISSNDTENRCSSYFWVDKYTLEIKPIPSKYFSYDQENYSFFGSTRKPCRVEKIIPLIKVFQGILVGNTIS